MSTLEFQAGNVCPNIELLRGLKRQEVDLILAAARVRRVPAKSVMTYQGEPADRLLLLSKGRARYFFETPNGKKLILIWITPGHAFGGAALVPRASTYLLSTETSATVSCLSGTARPFVASLAASLNFWKMQ